jgi:hypothetical protein
MVLTVYGFPTKVTQRALANAREAAPRDGVRPDRSPPSSSNGRGSIRAPAALCAKYAARLQRDTRCVPERCRRAGSAGPAPAQRRAGPRDVPVRDAQPAPVRRCAQPHPLSRQLALIWGASACSWSQYPLNVRVLESASLALLDKCKKAPGASPCSVADAAGCH